MDYDLSNYTKSTIEKNICFSDSSLIKETINTLLEYKKYKQLLLYLPTCLLFVNDDSSINIQHSIFLLTDFINKLKIEDDDESNKIICYISNDMVLKRVYVIEYSSTNNNHKTYFESFYKQIIQVYKNTYFEVVYESKFDKKCKSWNKVYKYLINIPTELATIEEYSKINMLIAGIDIKHSYVQAPTLTAQGEESITI